MDKKVIVLDVDEIIFPYITILCKEMQRKGFCLTEESIKEWGFHNLPAEVRMQVYDLMDSEIIMNQQKPLPGAEAAVKALQDMGYEVLFCSAVPIKHMTARALQLRKYFPSVPEENILLGSKKNLIRCDVILDDNPHNLDASNAARPVLLCKPWNWKETRYEVVENLPDFVDLLKGKKNCGIKLHLQCVLCCSKRKAL